MKTIWGETLNEGNLLPEYPRPQMAREQWTNLNGRWEYAFTKSETPPENWAGEILVPFSPEAPLSGVNRRLQPGEYLWYRRRFSDPRERVGERTLLHFGAVDQKATVWLNGKELGSHEGGYLPFSLDITDALSEVNALTLRVRDDTDAGTGSRGKQTLRPGGIWYTPQSGIWQTVWMENVPKEYIRRLVITPLLDEQAVEITVCSHSTVPCAVTAAGRTAGGMTNEKIRIPVPGCKPWSPETPRLYDIVAVMGGDCVKSYFALRKISVGPDENGVPRLLLNNEPYFQNGVLDQGYWPDGLYTPPSDEAMVYDIRLMKDMGFNMLRKHIKVEPLRWYYHCDRLGMLVWQDMVNGGGRYNPVTVTLPVFFGGGLDDHAYGRFARTDASGREQYRRELRELVAHLYNCPCIVLWTPFNEGWGQFEAGEIAAWLREELDDTRLIDHASGWHDQGAGDVKSSHVYFRKYRFRPDKLGRAVILSEFGGYARRVEGHCFREKQFGYKRLKTPEALLAAYTALFEEQILPAKAQGLCATVYTQLSDVEEETNGFVTYDRKAVKLPVEAVRAINHKLMQ